MAMAGATQLVMESRMKMMFCIISFHVSRKEDAMMGMMYALKATMMEAVNPVFWSMPSPRFRLPNPNQMGVPTAPAQIPQELAANSREFHGSRLELLYPSL